jgi:2,3-bisphosphoglycerate-independent phosphoglycerate mutase
VKYCVLIIDGAAGLPLAEHGGKTCLEMAETPNLDLMAPAGRLGLVRTVPPGMEPSSACACMSLLGYDPARYYRGRAAIEAISMGIPVGEGEVVYRCNLVAIKDGKMRDYSAGHIGSREAGELIGALNQALGRDNLSFYPGVSYRHLLKLKEGEDTLGATCTPPHDIPGQPVNPYLPAGPGSEELRDLMRRSEEVLRDHPVNAARRARGEETANAIWLFWGSGRVPQTPPFEAVYGLGAAITSGVDLLRGLGTMMAMTNLEIEGVSDGLDNDYTAQAEGALAALENRDLVVIHIEAPDEAGHAGAVADKIAAIEKADAEVVSRIRAFRPGELRVLVMPDHPTPITLRTHTADPVPFLLWGPGFGASGAKRFTEAEARVTGFFVEEGYNIMNRLLGE